MASADEEDSVATILKNDFLTCHICFEIYTEPRILSCLHTFCFKCICTHVDTTKVQGRPVTCPECRDPIPDDVASLKSNFFINGLSEIIKVKSAPRVDCTACSLQEKNVAADVKCLDCGDFLCASCSKGHNSSSMTWKHKKISLEDLKQGKYDKELRQMQKIDCPKHKKEVEFYCEECCQSVCLTCVILEHREHKCQTISEAVSLKRANILKLIDHLRGNKNSLYDDEKIILDLIHKLEEKKETDIKQVEKKAQRQVEAILKKREEKLTQVELEYKGVFEEKQSKLETLKLKLGLMSSCISFCDEVLDKAKDEEVLMMESMVINRLKHLQDDAQHEDPVESKERDYKSYDTEAAQRVHPVESKETKSKSKSQLVKAEIVSVQNSYADVLKPKPETGTEDQSSSDIKSVPSEKEPLMEKQTCKSRTETKRQLIRENVFIAGSMSDQKSKRIRDVTFSAKFGLLFADSANNNIKILATDGSFRKQIQVEGIYPAAVAVSINTIGVISENALCLLSSSGKLQKKILIANKKPDHDLVFTFSLGGTEKGFVVGNIQEEKRMRVYKTDGTLCKFIDCYVHFPLASISMSPSGSIAMSEWGGACVRVMTENCKVLTTCNRTSTWKPCDAAVNSEGSVFVADYDHSVISVFNSDGTHNTDHPTGADSVCKPSYVALDDQGRLYVVNRDGYTAVYTIL